MANLPDLPDRDPIAYSRAEAQRDPSKVEGKVTRSWLAAFQRFMLRLNTIAYTAGVTFGAALTFAAAILTTPIFVTDSAGRYRVNYYVRVTRAAGVSSSVRITVGWTEGGTFVSRVGALLNGNTTGTLESETFTIHSDAASSISIAAAYTSVGAPTMQYRLESSVEVMPV